jgi:hypothetical protein
MHALVIVLSTQQIHGICVYSMLETLMLHLGGYLELHGMSDDVKAQIYKVHIQYKHVSLKLPYKRLQIAVFVD